MLINFPFVFTKFKTFRPATECEVGARQPAAFAGLNVSDGANMTKATFLADLICREFLTFYLNRRFCGQH